MSRSPSKARFAVVGSRALDGIPTFLVGMLAMFPDGSTVVLRKGRKTSPGVFEFLVAGVCDALRIDVEWAEPVGEGRQATFFRDIDMVGTVDAVLAFFAEDEMSGGTEHVVEKAMDQMVPVYSYGQRDGAWVLIGSHDTNEAWPQFTI